MATTRLIKEEVSKTTKVTAPKRNVEDEEGKRKVVANNKVVNKTRAERDIIEMQYLKLLYQVLKKVEKDYD